MNLADLPQTVSVPDLELLRGERAARSLHHYLREMWPVVEQGQPFMDNWHIGAICEHLEAVTRFDLKTLIINVPFRSSKSMTVCVAWPTWAWAREPSSKWLFTSNDQDLSTRDSVKSRRVIESEWYQRRWGHVYQITTDQNTKTNYENDRSGYRVAGSVGSSVIGKGGDYRVIDDPHKTDVQESEDVREGKINWLKEDFSSRFVDPQRNALVVIMQRLNERDMSGYMLAEGWAEAHLCIPMEHESRRKIFAPCLTVDPRTEEGELMWPARFPKEVLEPIKAKLGQYGTAGQLQQRPSPRGGGIVKRENFKFYRRAQKLPLREYDFLALTTDAAFKDTSASSYVVTQAWGRKGPHNFLLAQVRERLSFTKTMACILDMRTRIPAHVTLIEDKANGPAIIDVLHEKVPGLIAVQPMGSKTARAEAAAPLIVAGNVWLPDPTEDADAAIEFAWVEGFIAEWCSVPTNAFWDQVDASGQYLNKYGRVLSLDDDDFAYGDRLIAGREDFSMTGAGREVEDDDGELVELTSATDYLGGVR